MPTRSDDTVDLVYDPEVSTLYQKFATSGRKPDHLQTGERAASVLALAQTCGQIKAEAGTTFYSLNKFRLLYASVIFVGLFVTNPIRFP